MCCTLCLKLLLLHALCLEQKNGRTLWREILSWEIRRSLLGAEGYVTFRKMHVPFGPNIICLVPCGEPTMPQTFWRDQKNNVEVGLKQ